MSNGRGTPEEGNGSSLVPVPGEPSISCAEVRDLLPLRDPADAGYAGLEEHLGGCPECAAEARFVYWMRALRPEPPAAILTGVLERARDEAAAGGTPRWHRRPPRALAWTLAAAAAAGLALGIGFLSDRGADPVWRIALDPEPAIWYGDEWVVAGGPVPDALADELLMALLEEMDP
ncbi:MAG: hypothetical protein OYK82_06850 [Gammaproteobacteria bacterium]|nr:hypothetical protein [Gammaproteobacteria bacterium]